MLPTRFVVAAKRVVSCAENGPFAIDDGAVLVDRDRIAAVGPRAAVLTNANAPLVAEGELLTPGLVDAHTHAAWMGSRDHEYAQRLAGEGYEAIAAAGGGIVSSMRAIRAASTDAIALTLRERLKRMARFGVTTVEVKSGYGLDEANERKQLDAIGVARRRDDVPRVIPTYLALHALPPESKNDRDRYVRAVADQWLPAIAKDQLAIFVDAYVDRAAFTVDEARTVLTRALDLGLCVRMHVGQFADVGGAALAAELGAASVDHVEHLSEADVAKLAKSGTSAILLPVASYTLRQDPPDVATLRKYGVPLVVASDANPGTAPTESLPLALAFAARSYGLTPQEALVGATRLAARSLGLTDVGTIEVGASADLTLWDLPHENALVQPWGAPPVQLVLARGRALYAS